MQFLIKTKVKLDSGLLEQSFNLAQTYLNTGLKTQNVEVLSLDSIIISSKISKVLVSKFQVKNSL